MSQLHSLFQTLHEDERRLLGNLRLIGKEKDVFSFIMTRRQSELPGSEGILRELALTDTHYYKINSVLLRKCYQALVPGEGAQLLRFLKLKNLFHLLRHEILTQDKRLAKTADSAEKRQFYLSAFHYFIDFPYKYYDKKLTDLFGQKYILSSGKSDEGDKLYVEYHKLFAEVNRMAARKNPRKALGISIQELLKREEKLRKSSHHLAQYYLYRAIASYYNYYEKDNGKVLEYLRKAIDLKEHIRNFFPIDVGQFLDLLYADALFQNNEIEAAARIYERTFKKGVDESMYGYYYHCEQYVLVSIIKGNYTAALDMLNKVFLPCINNRLDIYATRGAMSFVKLYLSQGELKLAAQYLNLAKEINEKTFYLPFDVQLRVLENIYFFLKGDFDFALQLANRNIKFLRAQEQDDVFSDYMSFWKIMIVFLNAIFRESIIAEAVLEEFAFLQNQYVNLYCNLFGMILQRAQKELV